jgi:hypothetical protein
MMPGVPKRRTHSYVRHGTTTLFAALDVASGFIIGKCYKRHRAIEFLKFLKEIDAQVPEGLDSSTGTTKTQSPSNGPSPLTRFWLQSNASVTRLSRHYVANFRFA